MNLPHLEGRLLGSNRYLSHLSHLLLLHWEAIEEAIVIGTVCLLFLPEILRVLTLWDIGLAEELMLLIDGAEHNE